ncbi:MAG: hypothetical protein WAP47_20820 [Candidatus Rokuibacteriota bacterium]
MLDALFVRLLAVEAIDARGIVIPELAAEILSSGQRAANEEIEKALHVLWRLMRHVSRKDCWWALRIEREDAEHDPRLRPEVRDYFARRPLNPRIRDARRRRRENPEEVLRDVMEHGKTFFEALDSLHAEGQRIHGAISALSGEMHGEADPMGAHLPSVETLEDSADEFWFYSADVDIQLQERFGLLSQLTEALRPRIGSAALFWATLGLVQDAISYAEPQGFEEEIEEGRREILRERGQSGMADLWDYWLWLAAETTEATRQKIFERMLEYVKEASTAEIETFFNRLDLAEPEVAERALPDPDKLWAAILQRQASDLSRELLARGGLYYWRSSERHYGQPLALAGLGIRCEECPEWWDIPPPLPLWVAARDAAQHQSWLLARDCFNRSLLDFGAWALLRRTHWRGERIEQFHFDLDFVREIHARQGSAETTRRCLHVAWRVLEATKLEQNSNLWRTLRQVEGSLGIQDVGTEIKLVDLLGEDLWGQLQPRTRFILVWAECLWTFTEEQAAAEEYAPIGVEYRRAIEIEWQRHRELVVGPWLEEFGKGTRSIGRTDRSIGAMLRVRQKFKVESRDKTLETFGHDSPLLDAKFVGHANQVWRDLNSAAHGEGWDREKCLRVRAELLREGMLKALLVVSVPSQD